MSGIVGIMNADGRPADRVALAGLLEAVRFRGPDGAGTWVDGPVGLGVTALGSGVKRPLSIGPLGPGGAYAVAADVRLDDRADLVRRLRAAGVEAADDAEDAELLAAAYHAWDEGCVDRLLGDFAFAVWDAPRRRLFCARDQLGIKQFYYAVVGSSFLFSNTLAALRRHPAVSDVLDAAAVGDFLLVGTNFDPATTLFRDVRRLPPAHTHTVYHDVRPPRCYWVPPADGHIRYRREGEYVEHFAELLRAAVADRLPHGRPVGVFLSGGLDSASIAAYAHRLEGGPATALRAFTVGYRQVSGDDEDAYAAVVARALGIPQEIRVSRDEPLYDRWESLIRGRPEPLDDPFSAVNDDLCSSACRHGQVVLTGQGGDVLLYPNPTYYADLLVRGRVKEFAREVARFARHFRRPPPTGVLSIVGRWRDGRAEGNARLPPWVDQGFAASLRLEDRWRFLNQDRRALGRGAHATHPQAYGLLLPPGPSLLVQDYDPEYTGLALEFRHPLFDLRLVEFVLAIPPLPWCFGKDLLRQCTVGLLPEAIRTRRKTPLGPDPVECQLQTSQWDWAEMMRPAPGLDRFVDLAAWGRTVASHSAAEAYGSFQISRPLHLNMWLRSLHT